MSDDRKFHSSICQTILHRSHYQENILSWTQSVSFSKFISNCMSLICALNEDKSSSAIFLLRVSLRGYHFSSSSIIDSLDQHRSFAMYRSIFCYILSTLSILTFLQCAKQRLMISCFTSADGWSGCCGERLNLIWLLGVDFDVFSVLSKYILIVDFGYPSFLTNSLENMP